MTTFLAFAPSPGPAASGSHAAPPSRDTATAVYASRRAANGGVIAALWQLADGSHFTAAAAAATVAAFVGARASVPASHQVRGAAGARLRAAPRWNRGGRICAAAAVSEEEGVSDLYMPILVDTPDGQTLQIELKPSDTILALKKMVQVEAGIADSVQELCFNDVVLEDRLTIAEYDLEEGSKVTLTVREIEDRGADASPVAEGSIRISVRPGPGEDDGTGVTLDIPLEATGKDLKSMAYKELSGVVEHLDKQPESEYGLFFLQSAEMLAGGQIRYLTRQELIKERKTVAENGLQGGERLVFASLFFLEG